jgi:hypothetical protein
MMDHGKQAKFMIFIRPFSFIILQFDIVQLNDRTFNFNIFSLSIFIS